MPWILEKWLLIVPSADQQDYQKGQLSYASIMIYLTVSKGSASLFHFYSVVDVNPADPGERWLIVS